MEKTSISRHTFGKRNGGDKLGDGVRGIHLNLTGVQVFENLESFAQARLHCGLALGVFDGFHLGHQAVIDAARGLEKVGVLSFEPHPAQVLSPERTPKRIITSFEHQKKILGDLAVDFLVIVEFTPEFAAREGRCFAEQVFSTGVKKLAAGEDWRFGKNRAGHMSSLAAWGQEAGVEVVSVEKRELGGDRISSSRIRLALAEGDIHAVAECLGRPYSVFGRVEKGQKIGRKLGFPTANVIISTAQQLLPSGVYLVEGNGIKGVANLGRKPTVVPEGEISLEVHLFSDEIPMSYGWDLEVKFLRKIRNEMKFSGVEALREQIARDVEEAQDE